MSRADQVSPARAARRAPRGPSEADFVFVADDCENRPDGMHTSTEVFGFLRLPGELYDDDAVLTAGLRVPIRSPVALWPELYLSRGVRQAWEELHPVLRAATAAA